MKQGGSSKKDFLKGMEFRIREIAKDVINTRVMMTQSNAEFNDRILELRRECTAISTAVGAVLDLLTDLTSMPTDVLNSRFGKLVDERSIVKSNGQIAGEVIIDTFNF